MKRDDITEVVELLNNKIKVLEALLECRDSEIDILKGCLKEIGTQINVDDIREPNFLICQTLLQKWNTGVLIYFYKKLMHTVEKMTYFLTK